MAAPVRVNVQVEGVVQVPADTATCADCLAELADPADRRYRYPFVTCTNCGPRFTVVRDVPYDRPFTTMSGFTMCQACEAEYHDPTDRRFHAPTTCCPACGPTVRFVRTAGEGDPDRAAVPGVAGEPALRAAADLLRAGEVVAVKGLGGYHLAVRADDEPAVARLRARKHREDKPFAVMVADLSAARALCEVDDAEARLLTGRRCPMVLLRRRAVAVAASDRPPVAASVAPRRDELAVTLPCTPLHHLLLGLVPFPVVLTSGNVADEPIAYQDDDAFARLGGIADGFVLHDRPIHVRTDDSVVRSFGDGREMTVRRARGYAPEPLDLPWEFTRPVLAVGGESKNTFCLGVGQRAIMSGHVGDLGSHETMRSFTEGIEHYQRLFGVRPAVVAHDCHPEYRSTKYALDRAEAEGLAAVDLVAVQHHHAHVASCLADNRHPGPALGVAFDGLGFGLDATMWGGEILLADLAGFTRLAHLEPVPTPGGAVAVRQPWRMAAAYLDAAAASASAPATSRTAGPAGHVEDLAVARRNTASWPEVVALARSGVGSPRTSSVGRLFDAVAALLDVRDTITYEGQAAIELEQLAAVGSHTPYRVAVTRPADGGPLRIQGSDIVRAVVDDLKRGVPAPLVAARFHSTIAHVVVSVCVQLRDEVSDRASRAAAAATAAAPTDHGLVGRVPASVAAAGTVALSGGVFGNVRLLRQTVDGLTSAGFSVLTHSRVPCDAGGLSLGQAVVAAASTGSLRPVSGLVTSR